MKKLLIIIITILCLIGATVYKAVYYNPHHLTIRTEQLVSNKINSSLDDTKLIYFSDLHFGEFTKEEDVENCVNLINKLDPDIVVFGGDLIDSYSSTKISQDQIDFLIKSFQKINASQGKFYILGNHDLENETSKDTAATILNSANFSSLINRNFQIYNNTNSYINIVGLDSLLKGKPDNSEAYKDINSSNYTITFTHCPDLFNDIPLDKTDYVISGHSHGGQIYFPLVNNFYRASGCKNYFYGKHNKNATTLDISNGVGLTSYSIRFQANSEIVFYKLKSK